MIDRRSFLRHLLSLPIAATLDVEKLLWIPKPIITIPGLTVSQITAIKLNRLLPKLKYLFDRDDTFYTLLSKDRTEIVSPDRRFRIPLIIELGKFK